MIAVCVKFDLFRLGGICHGIVMSILLFICTLGCSAVVKRF